MSHSSFWKLAAMAAIAALFYVAHGLHRYHDTGLPAWTAKAYAEAAADEESSEPSGTLSWERVKMTPRYFQTYRARVPGGWLVVTTHGGAAGGLGLTYCPDPEYQWEGAPDER